MDHRDKIEAHARALAAATTPYDSYLVLYSVDAKHLEAVGRRLVDDERAVIPCFLALAGARIGNRAAGFLALEDRDPGQPGLRSLIGSFFERVQAGDDASLPASACLMIECTALASQLSADTGLAALQLAAIVCEISPRPDFLTIGFQLAATIRQDRDRRAPRLDLTAILHELRYTASGAEADLERAIELGAEALIHAPAGGPGRAAYLSNQANRLQTRHGATGSAADLERAIELGSEALVHAPVAGAGRAEHLSAQAGRLQRRFEATRDQADLKLAIGLGAEALAHAGAGDPRRPTYAANQADRFDLRYQATGDRSDLEAAIAFGSQELHPRRPG